MTSSARVPQFGIDPEIWNLLPHDDCSTTALALAHASLPAPIFNHSLRVYLYSQWLCVNNPRADGDERDLDFDVYQDSSLYSPLILTACILHDVGVSSSPSFHGGGGGRGGAKQRFEVVGADCVKKHLIDYGFLELEAHNAWVAVAVHTSPGIAERIGPLARLVRLAVKSDFSRAVRDKLGAAQHGEFLEARIPRLEAEVCLADAVVAQAGEEEAVEVDSTTWIDTDKFPAGSWPGILLRAKKENPDRQGVNPAF